MAEGGIALDRAYLTAIWLETLFYGMNVVLFFSYLFISRYKRKQPHVNKVLMTTAVFMFLFSTTHVSLGFQRLIEGFIILRDAPGGPAAFFSDVSIPANVAKICIHTINSVLGDSIVVWRCWHVWAKNLWVCALPILLIMGSAAAGLAQTAYFAMAKDTHSAFNIVLEHWNGAVFGLSLCTNVIVTTLIAARIWYLDRQIRSTASESGSLRYMKVLALVVESGAIYSTALVCEITLYFLNNNAFYIVYDPIAQLTGIVPTMIIVLTSLGLTTNDLNKTSGMSVSIGSKPQFAPRTFGTDTTQSYYGAGPDPYGGSTVGAGLRTRTDPVRLDTFDLKPNRKVASFEEDKNGSGGSIERGAYAV